MSRTSFIIVVFVATFAGTFSVPQERAAPAANRASETIGAIDSDGNGRVSLIEIEDFARRNGVAEQEIRADFRDLDSNGDGELDAQEIAGLLSTSSHGSAAEAATVPAVEGSASPAVAAVPAVEGSASPAVAAIEEVPAVAAARAKPSALPAAEEAVPGLTALEVDAERQAGSVLAAGLAKRAQAMLQQGEKDAKEAKTFEAKAHALRGGAAAATKSLSAEARQAAQATIDAAAKQGLSEAQRLKHQAEELEKNALEHRNRAAQALRQAMEAQDGMSAVTKHLVKAAAI